MLWLLAGVLIVAIGPITAETARKRGLTVHIQPEKYTIPEMVKSIVLHFQKIKQAPTPASV